MQSSIDRILTRLSTSGMWVPGTPVAPVKYERDIQRVTGVVLFEKNMNVIFNK